MTATTALGASVAEQLATLAPERTRSPPLLDVAVRRTAPMPDGQRMYYLLPSDWRTLREHERAAGRPTPYWAVAWPSGLALARAVVRRASEVAGRRVLELGCGVGLPSVAAARAGAEVLATDGSPDAVVFAAHTLALNDVRGDVAAATWQEAADGLASEPWDLVLAADVLYRRDNVDALLRALPDLVERGGEFVLGDASRAGCRDFLAAARGTFTVTTHTDPLRERVNVHTLRRR